MWLIVYLAVVHYPQGLDCSYQIHVSEQEKLTAPLSTFKPDNVIVVGFNSHLRGRLMLHKTKGSIWSFSNCVIKHGTAKHLAHTFEFTFSGLWVTYFHGQYN